MTTLITGSSVPEHSALKKNGFTLIEVLISVMILSFGLIAVNQTLLQSLSILNYAQTRFQASRAAEKKIFEIQNQAWHQKKAPKPKESGVLLGDRKTFTYLLQSAGVRGSEFLYEVRMAIQWLESGKEKGLTRSFYARLPYVPKA